MVTGAHPPGLQDVLEFYDHHFGPGAYLKTHADHMARWHREDRWG